MESEEIKENDVVEPKVETPNSMYDGQTKEEVKEEPMYQQVANGEPLTNDKVNQLFAELIKMQQNQQIIINQTKKEEVKVENKDEIKY